jgi:SNF2 family DNA or RNA helicase
VPELDADQKGDVELLLTHKTWGLFHDVGVGKTPPAVVAATQRLPVLITCPAYLIPQWEHFIREWAPGHSIAAANGDGRKAREAAFAQEADFVLTSYNNWNANPPYRQMFSSHGNRRWGCFIFDEAHRLRGRNSQSTNRVYMLRNADNKNRETPMWFLTATPLVRDGGDAYPLFHLWDRRVYAGYWDFVNNRCVIKYTPWASEIGVVRDKKAFYEEMAQFSNRRVLDLGEPTFISVPVKLPPSVYATITRAKKEFRIDHADLPEELVYESAGVIWTKIRQLVSLPPTREKPKIDAAVGLLEDLPNERVLIGCWYRDTADAILERVLKLRPARPAALFTGGVSPKGKIAAIDLYNAKENGVIVATIAALKEGANLQAGRHIIMLEQSELPSDNKQFIGRQHRRGQERPVIVHNIWAERSVDLAVQKLATGRARDINQVMLEYILDTSVEVGVE